MILLQASLVIAFGLSVGYLGLRGAVRARPATLRRLAWVSVGLHWAFLPVVYSAAALLPERWLSPRSAFLVAHGVVGGMMYGHYAALRAVWNARAAAEREDALIAEHRARSVANARLMIRREAERAERPWAPLGMTAPLPDPYMRQPASTDPSLAGRELAELAELVERARQASRGFSSVGGDRPAQIIGNVARTDLGGVEHVPLPADVGNRFDYASPHRGPRDGLRRHHALAADQPAPWGETNVGMDVDTDHAAEQRAALEDLRAALNRPAENWGRDAARLGNRSPHDGYGRGLPPFRRLERPALSVVRAPPEPDEDGGERACLMCLDKAATCRNAPCGHWTGCLPCIENYLEHQPDGRCMLCRAAVGRIEAHRPAE